MHLRARAKWPFSAIFWRVARALASISASQIDCRAVKVTVFNSHHVRQVRSDHVFKHTLRPIIKSQMADKTFDLVTLYSIHSKKAGKLTNNPSVWRWHSRTDSWLLRSCSTHKDSDLLSCSQIRLYLSLSKYIMIQRYFPKHPTQIADSMNNQPTHFHRLLYLKFAATWSIISNNHISITFSAL